MHLLRLPVNEQLSRSAHSLAHPAVICRKGLRDLGTVSQWGTGGLEYGRYTCSVVRGPERGCKRAHREIRERPNIIKDLNEVRKSRKALAVVQGG